jgi:SAM-dependent methyltransferase
MFEFDYSAKNYNDILSRAVSASGHSWEYFAQYKANYVSRYMPSGFSGKILDFGCGIGNLVKYLRSAFPTSRIDGFDVSTESLKKIPPEHLTQGIFTNEMAKLDNNYDLIVAANVFHHIIPEERPGVVQALYDRMSPGGHFVMFEHNPLNPLTVYNVKHSPLDVNAVLARSSELKRLLVKNDFKKINRDYIVFFPGFLKPLIKLEPLMKKFPLGVQYALTGVKL